MGPRRVSGTARTYRRSYKKGLVDAAVLPGAALDLGEAAPDAVGLLRGQGVLEAFTPNGAGRADPLGPIFATPALRRSFGIIEAEEQDGGVLEARRVFTPGGVGSKRGLSHEDMDASSQNGLSQ